MSARTLLCMAAWSSAFIYSQWLKPLAPIIVRPETILTSELASPRFQASEFVERVDVYPANDGAVGRPTVINSCSLYPLEHTVFSPVCPVPQLPSLLVVHDLPLKPAIPPVLEIEEPTVPNSTDDLNLTAADKEWYAHRFAGYPYPSSSRGNADRFRLYAYATGIVFLLLAICKLIYDTATPNGGAENEKLKQVEADLERVNSELRQANEALNISLTGAKQENSELAGGLATLEQTNDALQADVKNASEEKAALLQDKAELAGGLAKLEQTNNALETDVKNASKAKAVVDQKNMALEAGLKNSSENYAVLEQKNKALKADVKKVSGEKVAFDQENKTLKVNIKNISEKNAALDQKNKACEVDIKNVSEQKAVLEKENADLRDRITALSSQNSEALNLVKDKANAQKALTEELNSAKKKIETFNKVAGKEKVDIAKAIEASRKNEGKAESKRIEAEKQNVTLRVDLEKARKEASFAKLRTCFRSKQLQDHQTKSASLTTEVANLKKALGASANQLRNVKANSVTKQAYDDFETTSNKHAADLATTQKSLDHVNSQLEKQASEVSELRKSHDELSNANKKTQVELSAMQNSHARLEAEISVATSERDDLAVRLQQCKDELVGAEHTAQHAMEERDESDGELKQALEDNQAKDAEIEALKQACNTPQVLVGSPASQIQTSSETHFHDQVHTQQVQPEEVGIESQLKERESLQETGKDSGEHTTFQEETSTPARENEFNPKMTTFNGLTIPRGPRNPTLPTAEGSTHRFNERHRFVPKTPQPKINQPDHVFSWQKTNKPNPQPSGPEGQEESNDETAPIEKESAPVVRMPPSPMVTTSTSESTSTGFGTQQLDREANEVKERSASTQAREPVNQLKLSRWAVVPATPAPSTGTPTSATSSTTATAPTTAATSAVPTTSTSSTVGDLSTAVTSAAAPVAPSAPVNELSQSRWATKEETTPSATPTVSNAAGTPAVSTVASGPAVPAVPVAPAPAAPHAPVKRAPVNNELNQSKWATKEETSTPRATLTTPATRGPATPTLPQPASANSVNQSRWANVLDTPPSFPGRPNQQAGPGQDNSPSDDGNGEGRVNNNGGHKKTPRGVRAGKHKQEFKAQLQQQNFNRGRSGYGGRGGRGGGRGDRGGFARGAFNAGSA